MLDSAIIHASDNVLDLLSSWTSQWPFQLKNKVLLTSCWAWLPKFILWKLWLEMNSRIFRDLKRTPAQVAIKVSSILSDTLSSKPSLTNEAFLSQEEEKWLGNFDQLYHSWISSLPHPKASWEICLDELKFMKWRSQLEKPCLFFDGASKGNPGAAGGGGVILDQFGNMELSYSWGLGSDTNNKAKALSLFQGLNQVVFQNIPDLVIIRDSKIIIQALKMGKHPRRENLAHILRRIDQIHHKFNSLDFYHVLCRLNTQADSKAKKGVLLRKGEMMLNGIISQEIIP